MATRKERRAWRADCCRVLAAFLTAFYVVCSQTESNRSDAYGKKAEEAEEADCKKAEKTKNAQSDWTGLRRAHGVAQSS
jgi:hypothetical protein